MKESLISNVEINFYKSILSELNIVFDVGCKYDDIFFDLNNNIDVHLFDPRKTDKIFNSRFNNIALGKEAGVLDYHPEYSSINKRTELSGARWQHLTHEYFEVDVDTIDNYCLNNNIKKIDLLKIDTEGWDYNVLLGAKDMLKNIKYIQFEHWHEKTKMITDLLTENNFN
jgi:FkbM family methyltransferase